jgi:4-alpha-glucanotransferase
MPARGPRGRGKEFAFAAGMTTRPPASAAFPRSAGVLLHPTSLPGPYGIGDLGPEARRFADALAVAGQCWWQMLPLNPPGAGASPYQCYSAFAGNPLLISPDDLVADGFLSRTDLMPRPAGRGPASRVDFRRAAAVKDAILARAFERFSEGADARHRAAFRRFCAAEAAWLDDYSLFSALRRAHPGLSWTDWPRPLARREPAALRAARAAHAPAVDRCRFEQFLFFRQLEALRAYARARGVGFIGDLPIFVSADSADVWTHPHLFKLDARGRPTAVAGVPPDCFSKTGQRWGNPLYHWPAMKKDRFAWWTARCRMAFRAADLVRIDHFRGFAACWEIPAGAPSAARGRWTRVPGHDLFTHFTRALGAGDAPLPFIAEDLGLITPDVERLRDAFRLPGMRVLQFAFDGDPLNPHLPARHTADTVAYTGTHDNDTTRGWMNTLPPAFKPSLALLAPDALTDPARALLRLAWSSAARLAVAPLQDVLALGPDARMNVPGEPEGNWTWRWTPRPADRGHFQWLKDLTLLTQRAPRLPKSRPACHH